LSRRASRSAARVAGVAARGGVGAGFPEADLSGPDLAAHRDALQRLLRAHQPYPALVVDRHWTVVLANAASQRLYGRDLVGANLVRMVLTTPAARQIIVNWPQVAWAGPGRLRQQRDQAPFDETLNGLVRLAEAALDGVPRPTALDDQPVLCPWFRIDDQIIKTIGIAARFEPTTDITLDELRIELTYPLDATADAFFRQQST
jgi:hypothetical protein